MYSQSLRAQLLRMGLLLAVVLVVLHNSPALQQVFARQAVKAGCHQQESVSSASPHAGHH
ncbi:hypothetical protein ACWJJH_17500 [Endozoicomonadaceae bacterium StTr2]